MKLAQRKSLGATGRVASPAVAWSPSLGYCRLDQSPLWGWTGVRHQPQPVPAWHGQAVQPAPSQLLASHSIPRCADERIVTQLCATCHVGPQSWTLRE